MSRVVLAMSGGVDSSVAAQLLIEAGHEVIGVFMRHGHAEPVACSSSQAPASPILPIVDARSNHKQGCCSAEDAEDGRRVADRLDIPFYALDLQDDFGRIIDYFVSEYTTGRTPNPCVVCNTWLKFGRLFDYADSVDAEFVATGHYARLTDEPGCDKPALRRGVDLGKDQSYVLFGVDRARLRRMMLPVGSYNKPQIRQLAAEIGLRVADKKDSQEICFVTSGKHDEFVRAHRDAEETSGDIVTTDGRWVGRHEGIEGFTIGQRKGLGGGLGEPHFVIRIEADQRRVVIGHRHELAREALTAGETNWLVDPPQESFRCLAKIRYNSPPEPATAEALPDSRLRVVFDEPRYGVAPGQAVVLYEADRVLGGGWIE